MEKIFLIIKREYLSRVKKKSFLIMTIAGPLLIVGMYALAIYFAVNAEDLDKSKKVFVIDQSNYFSGQLKNKTNIEFIQIKQSFEESKSLVKDDENNLILNIPKNALEFPSDITLYSSKQPNLKTVSSIESAIEEIIRNKKLLENGIDQKTLENLKTDVNIHTLKITEAGEENSSAGASYGIGFAGAILTYMFIFLYGVQVMRGVIEEKSNRIVEVIISSVKPFQLMMGKILGIALVGLTQFLLWVVLTVGISGIVGKNIGGDRLNTLNQSSKQLKEESITSTNIGVGENGNKSNMDKNDNFNKGRISDVLAAINTLNFPLILSCFLFYFLFGYLLYAALFAAIGSAVDSETETQQFMLPVTLPLIFSFIISSSAIVNAPDSNLAVWLSMIPFTAPVVMMVRIPFGVPTWQIICSMASVLIGFVGTVYLASRIYRIGILLYGKKVSFKELAKWIFYKG